MTDRLTEIFHHKEKEVAELLKATPLNELMTKAEQRKQYGRKFHSLKTALIAAQEQQKLPLIAEIKKSSPSKGVIRQNFVPPAHAHDYMMAGASALSILTDQKYFGGSPQYLKEIATMTERPLLQKDFIFCEEQLYYAVAISADVVLLILTYLDDRTANHLEKIALSLGLEVLLETHNQEEIKRANNMASPLVGVNNRNLKDFSVSLDHGKNLLMMIDKNKLAIAESGIDSPESAYELWQAGARGFLMGEYFMKSEDIFTSCLDFITASNKLIF